MTDSWPVRFEVEERPARSEVDRLWIEEAGEFLDRIENYVPDADRVVTPLIQIDNSEVPF